MMGSGALFNEICNPKSKNSGLPGTGAGNDHDRPIHVHDRFLLNVVEGLKIIHTDWTKIKLKIMLVNSKSFGNGIMYFGGHMTTLDIILPAYNPLPGWEEVVIDRFLSLENQLKDFQLKLIIVNDGSSKIDESVSVVKLKSSIPGLQWISIAVNKGKGYALRKGVQAAESSLIIYTDIDWPYTEQCMVGLIRELALSADAVIGTRDEDYSKHLPPARKRIFRFLKKINAGLLRLKVTDTQAGLKGFKNHLKDTFLSTTINRYLFDLEFIHLLSKNNQVAIKGYSVTLRPDISFSKMNRKILLQEGMNFLKVWLRR